MPPGATNTEAAKTEDMSDKEIITVYEVKYNTEFHSWEVYSDHSVVRAGVRQPVFVSAQLREAQGYVINCGGVIE